MRCVSCPGVSCVYLCVHVYEEVPVALCPHTWVHLSPPQGASSRCYKLTDMCTSAVFALKVVPRGGGGAGRLRPGGKVRLTAAPPPGLGLRGSQKSRLPFGGGRGG